MLDIKFIRENKDLVKEAARKKCLDFDVEELLEVDSKRLAILREVEDMRAKQNAVNSSVASAQDPSERERIIEEMRILKATLSEKENDLKQAEEVWKSLMYEAPNIPDFSVPEGKDDSANKEIRIWGDEHKQKGFDPKSHTEIMQNLDLADFERGAKVSGFRGYYLKNDGALLTFAIWQFVLDELVNAGFSPMIAPSLVRKDTLYGTGYLPQGEEDMYKTQDDDYLAGTGEVAAMSYYSGEVLPLDKFPIKILAFSPCFRREAGSHGKDTKGLIRVHEFMKLEQIVLCKADHQESIKWHEQITNNTQAIMQKLKIPYRIVLNCGGDLGLGQVKKYDIEAWVPSEGKYRETHSSSYFHDFQTRRLNIKYKDENGNLRFAHSLNNTAIATPRILVPILENYQQEDGSVTVPEVLRKYIGKDRISLK
ncbi:MAG: serine--tRNA ligase [bacterium]|nr:serine--tRNA ligase [bacterium]